MPKVLWEKKNHIICITINRPEKKNCIDAETEDLLIEAWNAFKYDDDAYVAVLTGAGDESFCSGADLGGYFPKLTGGPSHLRRRAYDGPGFGGFTRGIDIFKPMICAINGLCAAGGLELAVACDIRVASEHSSFGCLERRWNVGLGDGGTQRLPRIVGLGRALELIITGKLIDCEEAYRIGLVNEITPRDGALGRALEMAEMICGFPQGAIRVDKEATMRGLGTPLTEGLRIENMLFNTLLTTHDFYEGPVAFIERRPPEYDNQ
ncbi:MAG: enoyl-CoA hydratase/isomerase family protein [Candidatus Geothermincolia bacterium]